MCFFLPQIFHYVPTTADKLQKAAIISEAHSLMHADGEQRQALVDCGSPAYQPLHMHIKTTSSGCHCFRQSKLRTIKTPLVFWSLGNSCRLLLMRHLSTIIKRILFPLPLQDCITACWCRHWLFPNLSWQKKVGGGSFPVSIIKVQRSCLTTRLLLCFSISNRSRLCWVSLHRGESAYRQLCGRRRQDLLLL